MWLFLASEAMLFASLFSAYVMLRAGAVEWPKPIAGFPWLETVLLVGASATFSKERIRLIAAHTFALTFVVIKLVSDLALIRKGITPATDVMWACWFALSGVHLLHVLGGAVFTGWLGGPSYRMSQEDPDRFAARIDATRRYWLFVDFIWLLLVLSFYVV
jgi:heme/copper-type cytochrome/quinol oxidase subunit 3